MQSEQIYAQVKEVLNSLTRLELGIIFGSAISGRLQQISDLDIAVMADKPLSFEDRVFLIQALEKRLQREVDLVDLFDLHGPLLQQILTRGKIVLKKSSSTLAMLLKRMWYDREDMLPLIRYVQKKQLERYFYGQGRNHK